MGFILMDLRGKSGIRSMQQKLRTCTISQRLLEERGNQEKFAEVVGSGNLRFRLTSSQQSGKEKPCYCVPKKIQK
jgi:hypothetical protein